MAEREWLTKAEVINLVHQELAPFHKDNLARFDKLFASMNEMKGAVKMGTWIIGLAIAVLAIVVGVRH